MSEVTRHPRLPHISTHIHLTRASLSVRERGAPNLRRGACRRDEATKSLASPDGRGNTSEALHGDSTGPLSLGTCIYLYMSTSGYSEQFEVRSATPFASPEHVQRNAICQPVDDVARLGCASGKGVMRAAADASAPGPDNALRDRRLCVQAQHTLPLLRGPRSVTSPCDNQGADACLGMHQCRHRGCPR